MNHIQSNEKFLLLRNGLLFLVLNNCWELFEKIVFEIAILNWNLFLNLKLSKYLNLSIEPSIKSCSARRWIKNSSIPIPFMPFQLRSASIKNKTSKTLINLFNNILSFVHGGFHSVRFYKVRSRRCRKQQLDHSIDIPPRPDTTQKTLKREEKFSILTMSTNEVASKSSLSTVTLCYFSEIKNGKCTQKFESIKIFEISNGVLRLVKES